MTADLGHRAAILALAALFAGVAGAAVSERRAAGSTGHGPPSYVVAVTAPIAPVPSATWASVATPYPRAVAAVDGLCDALQAIKGDDLALDWRPVCLEIAARAHGYGVRPALAVSVAWCESKMHRYTFGAAGEVGPMQVKPDDHCEGGYCADPIGAGLAFLGYLVAEHGEHDATCRYRGLPVGCPSRRVALADAIEGE